MKYYQVHYFDRHDPANSGVIPGFYISKEEAEKCAEWNEKHPDPLFNYSCYVQEIDLDCIINKFEPSMTEEEYRDYCEHYFDVPEPEYPPSDYYD